MNQNEEQLRKELEEATKELKEARRVMTEARKRALDAETRTINAKIAHERITEKLRVLVGKKVINGESYALFDEEDGTG